MTVAAKDITEKTLESFNDVFSDILNVLVFNGKITVEEDSLEQAIPHSFYKADGKLRSQERDIAKYWNSLNIHIALWGIENESRPKADMPLRIIGYDGAAYRNQLYSVSDEDGKRKPNVNPRYPVISLVLYFGYKEHWSKPKNLLQCLADYPPELQPYVSDYKINVFEIAYLSDEQVSLFKSDFRFVADYFAQMRKNNDYVPPEGKIRHVRELLELMAVLTNDHRFEEVVNDLEGQNNVEVRNMSEVLDRVENKGRIEGRSEGRILEHIDIRREEGYSDEEIIESLMKKFKLTDEQASEYLHPAVIA